MPKIGVCTWTYGEMSLQEIAMRAQKSGFEGVELFGNIEEYKAGDVRKTLGDYNLPVFSVTPADFDLAHPDGSIRQKGIDYNYKLLDFAAELGEPIISCHGLVGRLRAIETQQKEEEYLLASVKVIAQRARQFNLRLVMECLNRYESHLVNSATAASKFIEKLGEGNVGILLDAYHMNIEEKDLPAAARLAGDRLWLFHVADSNREGIGRGHTDFQGLFGTFRRLHYEGPVILECSPPGPDPFATIKDETSLEWLKIYYEESIAWIRRFEA